MVHGREACCFGVFILSTSFMRNVCIPRSLFPHLAFGDLCRSRH